MTKFKGQSCKSWKDFFDLKTQDEKFIKKIEIKGNLEYHVIEEKQPQIGTEIILIYLRDSNYKDMFDVQFKNPNSPAFSLDQESNPYGFDGIESKFTDKNIKYMEEWIDIPLKHGWTEELVYLNNKHIFSNLAWLQGKEKIEFSITVLKGHGFKYRYSMLFNRDAIKKEKRIIEPLI